MPKFPHLLFLICLLLSSLLCCSGCGSKASSYIDFEKDQVSPPTYGKTTTDQRPLRIAVASVISPKETINCYRTIADHVAKATGRPTLLVQRKTYAEVNMLMANGDVDIAFMSTGAYSSYRGMNEIEVLVMAEHQNSLLYTSNVIVHRDSGIGSIEQLRGKTFAFTDPLSFSGHMVIEDYLNKRNTVPEKYFKHFFYTYSHDKSIWAVANKLADAASIDSQIYEYARLQDPALTDKVRIISDMAPAPTGPVTITQAIPPEQREALRRIFLEMSATESTAEALQQLLIDRFVQPQPELYEPLKKIYDRASVI